MSCNCCRIDTNSTSDSSSFLSASLTPKKATKYPLMLVVAFLVVGCCVLLDDYCASARSDLEVASSFLFLVKPLVKQQEKAAFELVCVGWRAKNLLLRCRMIWAFSRTVWRAKAFWGHARPVSSPVYDSSFFTIISVEEHIVMCHGLVPVGFIVFVCLCFRCWG
jgi:hypothetical protein